jgi:hypothetical protein
MQFSDFAISAGIDLEILDKSDAEGELVVSLAERGG